MELGLGPGAEVDLGPRQEDSEAMADGELTLTLDDETARRLQEAADAAGRPLRDYVGDLIANHLAGDDEWAEDERIADESERTGAFRSVEEAMAHFRSELHAQVKKDR